MTMSRKLIFLAILLGIGGCATNSGQPLVFVQAQTVGITANAGGPQATPELTVGFRDLDVAVVPTESSTGTPVRSVLPGQGGRFSDALSVLGQFSVGATAGTGPNATLGKFFATGTAASKLAEGFKAQLAK